MIIPSVLSPFHHGQQSPTRFLTSSSPVLHGGVPASIALREYGLTLPAVQRYKIPLIIRSPRTHLPVLTCRKGTPQRARVAELADARDLGSRGQPWGFKSPLSHHSPRRTLTP
jgi:hypothetical protein